MTHLGERAADFVFGELSADEIAQARLHLKDCEECRQAVQRLEQTQSILKTFSDVEPPRQIVFEVEKPRPAFKWSWFAPLAAAAGVILAVFVAAPVQIQWGNSQLAIVFGKPSPAPAPSAAVSSAPAVVQQPATAQPAAEKIDYEQIRNLVSAELQKRDKSEHDEILQLEGAYKFLDSQQTRIREETEETAGNVQALTARSASRD